MAEAYPTELRARVVEAYESGEGSYPTIAVRFALGEATVRRWVQLCRLRGDVEPTPKGGGNRSTISEAEIEAAIKRLRDPTAGELAAELNRNRTPRARLHVSSIKRALHRFGYAVKKSADGHWRVCDPM